MKKFLIPLAVLGLSGAALAQSSVTLYGKADAGVGKIELGSAPGAGDANNKTQFISGSTMNAFTSRVGVRGTEDLGGGLKIGYNFESGIDLNNGGTTTSTFWGRQANLSISSAWGTLKLGRQYTPSYLINDAFDLTDQTNYSVLGDTYAIATRANSAFAYVSPNFNGLTAMAAFVSKNDCPTAACSKNAWDVGAMYANGPISAGASVNKTGGGKTGYQVGGKYDFGAFLLAASYNQAVSVDEIRRGFELGGTVKFGALALTLDLTRDTRNDFGPKKYTNEMLELRYTLSKRTFLYAAYLHADHTNNYGIGIDHNF